MGGADWAAVEAPLGEVAESYQFEVLDGGAPVWSQLVSTPSAVLSAAEESTLFAGAPLNAFDVRVAQVSQRYGVGARRTVTVYL